MEKAVNQELIELTKEEQETVSGGSTSVVEADLLPPPTPYPHVNRSKVKYIE